MIGPNSSSGTSIRMTVRVYMMRPHQKAGDLFDRFLCGAQSDALQRAFGELFEPFHR